jgi:uncharacterized protein YbjT (DUF2867 family)
MPTQTDNRTALVFGASGLIGNQLVHLLNQDATYSSVILFVRSPLGSNLDKVHEQVVDFSRLPDLAPLIKGDDLYICLGTTRKKAGSVKRVEEIDRDLPVGIARMAAKNQVTRIAVVSSMGADRGSGNYYLRIKGEMEEGIRNIGFEQTIIARPSMLFGPRKEFRLAEKIAGVVMKGIGFLLVGKAAKYRGIEALTVARAMLALIKSSSKQVVFQSDELEKTGTR